MEGLEKNMNVTLTSLGYHVRPISDSDISLVLELYESNPLYFHYCPPFPSKETVKKDMVTIPEGLDKRHKHFLGIWKESNLIAILDLLEGFPNKNMVWIGLFMVHGLKQRNGLGTKIIDTVCEYLTNKGFKSIRLGYVKGNLQTEKFWKKNMFCLTGNESVQEHGTILIAEKILN